MNEKLYTPQELADWRGTTVAALAQERYKGTGPRFIKLGKTVRYSETHVKEWLDANTHQRTA
ncbi:helix-turn-helix transcriptional regulator [Galactobacter caseinivorans]|uniref:DNA-binding protein n=1 Tax=Galactobacter caseinivorans TaxID=2676123 RepID=A0A496PH99_9MICC|nr:DNA-binding protein [Galactobacter caseinivorans]RKW69858.1 DNA-binding protein [Galactobacter caseinivorans]